MSDFVERPGNAVPFRHDYAALIETASNGKAVLIAIKSPLSRPGVVANIDQCLRRRGYKAHSALRDGQLFVWAEKIAPA